MKEANGAIAIVVACAIMVTVEKEFGMNDINFVVIATMATGLICAGLRIRGAGRLAARQYEVAAHA